MTNWELIPVRGLSDLKLGEERAVVRQRFRKFKGLGALLMAPKRIFS
jgi:hypothetical protein